MIFVSNALLNDSEEYVFVIPNPVMPFRTCHHGLSILERLRTESSGSFLFQCPRHCYRVSCCSSPSLPKRRADFPTLGWRNLSSFQMVRILFVLHRIHFCMHALNVLHCLWSLYSDEIDQSINVTRALVLLLASCLMLFTAILDGAVIPVPRPRARGVLRWPRPLVY